MEASDERWNDFIEEYGDLLKSYKRLQDWVIELLDVEDLPAAYTQEFEDMTNGEG